MKISKEYKDAKYIRVSCAYLFRIKIDNEYLLTKDEQGRDTFQPVGGVYKYTDEKILTDFQATQCTRFGYSSDLDSDLRLIIPRKKLNAFDRWYQKEIERETLSNLYREFREEILDRIPQLNPETFATITYKYCGQSLTTSRYRQRDLQLHYADIVELILTPQQAKEILALRSQESGIYHFATKDEIYEYGRINGNQVATISNHAYKIVEDEEVYHKFYHKKYQQFSCSENIESEADDEIVLHELPALNKEEPFFFVSYNSIHKSKVWDFCIRNQSDLGNFWIDRKNVGDRWDEDVKNALNSEYCKNAILFINKQYLLRSTACYSEAKIITDNHLSHLVVLVDIDTRFVTKTIRNWIDNDAADKEKLVIFKKVFNYNDNTGHIDNSVYDLNLKTQPLILQTIRNMVEKR